MNYLFATGMVLIVIGLIFYQIGKAPSEFKRFDFFLKGLGAIMAMLGLFCFMIFFVIAMFHLAAQGMFW